MGGWYTNAGTRVCFNTHGELSTCVNMLFRFRKWQNIPYPLVKIALEIKLRLRHLIYDVKYTADPPLIKNLPKFIYGARELMRNPTPTECH